MSHTGRLCTSPDRPTASNGSAHPRQDSQHVTYNISWALCRMRRNIHLFTRLLLDRFSFGVQPACVYIQAPVFHKPLLSWRFPAGPSGYSLCCFICTLLLCYSITTLSLAHRAVARIFPCIFHMPPGLLRTLPRTDSQSSPGPRLRPGPFPRIWASGTKGNPAASIRVIDRQVRIYLLMTVIVHTEYMSFWLRPVRSTSANPEHRPVRLGS